MKFKHGNLDYEFCAVLSLQMTVLEIHSKRKGFN